MEEESIKLKKTILAFENQLIKNIQPLILEKLKAKYKVILVVKTTEDKKFYLNKYKNCFDQIIVYVNEFEILKKNISEKLTEKKAIQFESKLDKSLYRIFLAERVIGRGYFSSGGFRHPRNRLHYENSHLQMLKLGVAKLDFWESFFKKTGFKIKKRIIMKERHKKVINKKNDDNIKEKIVNFEIGGFERKKIVYLLTY